MFERINQQNECAGMTQTEVMVPEPWFQRLSLYLNTVSVATGNKVFANNYLILPPWVILISSGQIVHKSRFAKLH